MIEDLLAAAFLLVFAQAVLGIGIIIRREKHKKAKVQAEREQKALHDALLEHALRREQDGSSLTSVQRSLLHEYHLRKWVTEGDPAEKERLVALEDNEEER